MGFKDTSARSNKTVTILPFIIKKKSGKATLLQYRLKSSNYEEWFPNSSILEHSENTKYNLPDIYKNIQIKNWLVNIDPKKQKFIERWEFALKKLATNQKKDKDYLEFREVAKRINPLFNKLGIKRINWIEEIQDGTYLVKINDNKVKLNFYGSDIVFDKNTKFNLSNKNIMYKNFIISNDKVVNEVINHTLLNKKINKNKLEKYYQDLKITYIEQLSDIRHDIKDIRAFDELKERIPIIKEFYKTMFGLNVK